MCSFLFFLSRHDDLTCRNFRLTLFSSLATACPLCVFRTIDTSAYYNVLVLIGSLVGTVVYIFATILQLLEHYGNIPSVEPAGSTSVLAGAHAEGKRETAAAAGTAAAASAAAMAAHRGDPAAFAAFNDVADDSDSDGGGGAIGSVVAGAAARGRVSRADGVRIDQCAIELQPVAAAAHGASVAAHHHVPTHAEMADMIKSMQQQISSLLEARHVD